MSNKELVHVDVMFRMFRGECIAVFPNLLSAYGNAVFFTLESAHGEIDYKMLIKNSRPAVVCEYENTFACLVGIGYVLNIVKGKNRKKL